ncbi:O-acetylserine/cysteine efflux transporter [Enhydrobacter aerosaccus]|uniref:O-acetylserine/cysteine efflux transporter n=1 Tax=Enhydrobacter aerosaccus TaxID=225324 RepID=A0A1T4PU67_9HYPH|nr:EamA family transporter [Enhydrobacter aerosaccus]SJZ94989.1 O-acetylserine/cysteine efflux transporter [Enhydrobacter aerosaccus]
MKPLHVAAALLIAALWGLNFTVIRLGLDVFTPFTFAGWRFLLGALPVLFLPRPPISWRALAGIGFFMFTGQFVFLFFAMQAGLPPGLSSVLVQLQGPLTVVLAALFLHERTRPAQWLGLGVALIGVLVIARSVEGSANVLAVGIALLSALSWAVGNLFLREARGAPVFAVTAWASLLPPLPLLIAAALTDGIDATLSPILAPSWQGWLVLFYTVVPAMWLGYLIWGTLLRSYPAAKVGPVSLLVPCCALFFASQIVGEPIGGVRLIGVAIVLAGVAIGIVASARRL